MRPLHLLLAASLLAPAGCTTRQATAAPSRISGREAEARAALAFTGSDDDEDDLSPGSGAKRWKDTIVYVDGRPRGALNFGELPITLQPVWIDEKVSAEIEPGSHAPGYRLVKQRRYRFTDYLKAIGVDLAKVRELHVCGPRFSETIVVKGAELRSAKAQEFLWRFGGDAGGKAIPFVPPGFGNGFKPDKVSQLMVYINREPPKVVPSEGLAVDGRIINNVPYYGEPLRRGVRVYLDDRIVAVIQRPMLRDLPPVSRAGNTMHWSLLDVLADAGVPLQGVAEGWTIANERRGQRFDVTTFADMTVMLGAHNELLLGAQKTPAAVLALHTRHVAQSELPRILPEEEQ